MFEARSHLFKDDGQDLTVLRKDDILLGVASSEKLRVGGPAPSAASRPPEACLPSLELMMAPGFQTFEYETVARISSYKFCWDNLI